MVKLVKIIIFMTALSSSVFSAPSQLFYEKVLSGGENIVHVEPILDSQNELSGFVYTDSANGEIIYDNITTNESTIIEIGGKIFKTIHSYSGNFDTLYLYSLNVSWTQPARIHKISLFDETFTIEEIEFSISGFNMSGLTHADLRFDNDKLIVEISYLVQITTIPGWQTDNYSRSYVVDLDSFTIENLFYDRNVFECHFTNEESNDKFTISEIISNGFDIDSEYYEKFYIYQLVYFESDDFFVDATTALGETYSYFVDNFAPSSPTEELIIHANSANLLEYYDKENHIACYSFADGIPTELWHNNEVGEIDFSYTYKAKDLLVGTSGAENIIMLNYLNGQVMDSSVLDSPIQYKQFFETDNEQSLLNVVGMSFDTLKSYRFDIATEITEPTHPTQEIPKTFSLLQNHPNPFNGETRLEFSTTENQYLKLSVFNILGQEIKTLAANRFSPGTYSFYWNGSDENGLSQSTGIYFARLESDTDTELIKLIYLK